MRNPFDDKKNSEIMELINEYIHSERDRALLSRKFVDGVTFEALSEEFSLSTTQTKRIIYKQSERLSEIMRV